MADAGPAALLEDSTDDVSFDDRADVGRMPIGMVVPTIAMVAAGLVLTIWAGPFFDFTESAAADLLDSSIYLDAVLGEGR
jgi:multicomponent Na+:H+ antiporter subunit D